MAKEYNVGGRLYLPVWVTDMETNVTMGPDKSTTITDAKFAYTYCPGRTNIGAVRYGEEGLLLTAEEIYFSRQMADKIEHMGEMLEYGRKKYDEIEELKARIAELEKENCEWKDAVDERIVDVQHLTEEGTELKADYDEIKSRNAELEALLKEVMATRDEAIKQNNELIADRNNWKEASQRYHDSAKVADAAADELRKENKELLAAVDKLKDTLVDRTKDVQHLTGENEKLKAELDQRNKDFWAMKKDRDELDCIGGELRAQNEKLTAERNDLKSQVGKNLAEIQNLTSEVHFHKEFGEGLDKQQKELQARYDELDSVNKEQAEKIRKLDKALSDLKRLNDNLRADNTNLTFLLEDAPEKEVTKTLHVTLNDGTEIEFRRYTDYQYRTDVDMFVVKDGEKYIAGFLRGDKPGNLAYWMGE